MSKTFFGLKQKQGLNFFLSSWMHYFYSRDGPGTTGCMQSHHPHLRDLWLLGWLPCRWRKRKKNSASGKSRLCTKNILTFQNQRLPFLHTQSIVSKWLFFIQFFPEYRRDDSFVNPHLLDHPLGAPLVKIEITQFQAAVFMPSFAHPNVKFIYLFCNFGTL